MAQVLIVEDESLLAKSIARYLTGKGHDCFVASTGEAGLALLEKSKMDIALLDLQLPGISGLETLKRLREADPDLVVIIATAHGTMAAAVEAMRLGANDFLRKPLDMEELSLTVIKAIDNSRIRQKITYYHDREAEQALGGSLVCHSPKMREVSTLLERIITMDLERPSDYPPVLILGETGTGKDLIARSIHYRSRLSPEAFIEVNCSTLPKGLEEAELFGYEKGSFSGALTSKRGLFEAAIGGTIFLNEIGDLSPDAQVKILQVIERKTLRRIGGLRDIPLDVRIIAATNRDLRDANRFREDLYYRLNNLTITTPPLRERTEDILELAELFLTRYSQKYAVEKVLTPEACASLISYHWPGNVRELRQLIERVTFLSSSPNVTASDLNIDQSHPTRVSVDEEQSISVIIPDSGVDFEALECEIIKQALIISNGNVSQAAQVLRLGREALRYRITKHNIAPNDFQRQRKVSI